MLFSGLGWNYDNPTLRGFSQARSDVKKGLMVLIFQLGRLYVHAQSNIPDRETVQTEDFMDFNSMHPTYFLPSQQGYYGSTVSSIATYMLIISKMSETRYSADVREMLLLTMIYDFMAYAFQQNRVSIDSGILLPEARRMMIHSIRAYKGTATYASYTYLINVLISFARASEASPSRPASPPPRRLRIQCVVVSSQDNAVSRESSEEENDDDNIDDDEEEEDDHAVVTEDSTSSSSTGIRSYEETDGAQNARHSARKHTRHFLASSLTWSCGTLATSP